MKFKKSISTLCAAAVILSAFSFANAATPQGEISENAGRTIQCIVVEDTDEGTVTHTVDVYIPEGTTKEEEAVLARSAILPTPAARTANALADVSMVYDIELLPPNFEPTYVGGGTLPLFMKTFYVSFGDIFAKDYSVTKTVTVKLKNLTSGKSGTKSFAIDSVYPTGDQFVFFVLSRGDLELREGDEVEVYAYTNAGVVTAEYCQVFGYDVDFG